MGKLLFRPIVNHDHLFEVWLEDFHKRLVSRVRKIDFSVFFAFETDQKAVRQFVVQLFGAVVGPVFEICDLRNLVGQITKRVDDFLNIRFTARVLEVKHDDVTQHLVLTHGSFLVGVNAWKEQSGRNNGNTCHRDDSLIHDCFLGPSERG